MRRIVVCLAFFLGWCCLQTPAADAPLRVYRDRVRPHWFADNSKFWYRVNVADGQFEFILVDAAKGTRQPAFDHERLAKVLQAAGLTNATAKALPLQELEFDSDCGAVRFRADERNWRCDLQSYALTELPKTVATKESSGLDPARAPRASRRTGEETSLLFINRTSGEVNLYWLDSGGKRQSYGKLAPGERREQHTFAGHVWLVTDVQGKPLVVFEADETGGEAPIR